MMAIIFAETGAMIFFLPGDSLLVTAGSLCGQSQVRLSLPDERRNCRWDGDLGRRAVVLDWQKTGPALFSRPKSRLFNPEHIRQAHAFYEKHGGKTIIIARFMPILRTFVPVVAGIGAMTYRRFALYNVIGAVSWVCLDDAARLLLGSLFEHSEAHRAGHHRRRVFFRSCWQVIAFARMKLGAGG